MRSYLVLIILFVPLLNRAFGSGHSLDNWIVQKSGASAPFSAVAFGNGVFVAASGFLDAPSVLLVSTNGKTWLNRTDSVAFAPFKLVFTNGLFVGGGKDGRMLSSANGYDWVEQASGFSSAILGVTYFKSNYVAFSQRMGVAISQDAQNWLITRPEFGDLVGLDIKANADQVVFTGAYGDIGVSANGVLWEMFSGPALWQITPFRDHWVEDYLDKRGRLKIRFNGTWLVSCRVLCGR